MASSTTKPVEIVSAISDRLLRLKPSRYIAANEPMIDTGTATLGTAEARTSRRNTNTTRMTRRDRGDQRLDRVVERAANGDRAVDDDLQVDVARQRRDQPRQLRLHIVDGLDDVGAGFARQHDADRRLAVGEAGVAQILDRILDVGDVAASRTAALLR